MYILPTMNGGRITSIYISVKHYKKFKTKTSYLTSKATCLI